MPVAEVVMPQKGNGYPAGGNYFREFRLLTVNALRNSYGWEQVSSPIDEIAYQDYVVCYAATGDC
jgi:hypothetical protein